MKFKVSVDLPERAAIVAGLVLRVPPALDEAVTAAESTLTELQARRDQASRDVTDMRERVARGAAAPQALEEALHRFNAANQVIEPAERRLASASEARTAGIERHRKELLADATARRDELQAVADRVAPLLEELKVLETALDTGVRGLGQLDGVPAVRWPACLADDVAAFNNGLAAVASGIR